MKTLVVNLLGGPGCGKSTMAARIFATLKENGYSAELATEYAKDMVWQESNNILNNQVYIFGKQHNRIWRLYGKVRFIITDAPLINSLVYGDTTPEFKAMVLKEIEKFDHFNIFLDRIHDYEASGRLQTENQAQDIDQTVLNMLQQDHTAIKYEGYPYLRFMMAKFFAPNELFNRIYEEIHKAANNQVH